MSYTDVVKMLDMVEDALMEQVYKFLWIGLGMFVATFLNAFCWTMVGLRMLLLLKQRYFVVILKQEQGWFDSNNAFEFATKVQAQLEQVEMGIGEKIGSVVQMVSQVIVGLIIAFTSSWKLTLIMLCVAPFIVIKLIFNGIDYRHADLGDSLKKRNHPWKKNL